MLLMLVCMGALAQITVGDVEGKTFTMQCARGYVYWDGSTMIGHASNKTKFAIVTYNDETYLYDATNNAFVCHSTLGWTNSNGNPALESNSDLSKAVKNISFGSTEIAAYPNYVAEGVYNTWLNMDGNPKVYLNKWTNFESGNGGNTYKIEIVDDFDNTDALAVLGTWCMGDLLGGSISGSDNWANTWSSGTSPSFTLTASAANINHKNNRTTGGLDIRSGSAGTSTYTITAPTGYMISGYVIEGRALSGNQTVTPSAGGSATTFTSASAGNVLTVSGLRTAQTTFTLAGANQGLFIRAMKVTLSAIPSSITSLPTANDKAYVISSARGNAWNFADNATSMGLTSLNLNSTNQQIALIYHNSEYYLFSVNKGKYLTASNTLTSMPTDDEQVSVTATGDATYPWFFKFKNVANKNINDNNAGSIVISSWNTVDAGNKNAIIEAADFDATIALAMFDTRSVTYNLSYGGNSTFRTVDDVTVSIGADAADFVPSSFVVPTGVQYTYSPATIAAETTEVTVTAQWRGPFNIASAYNAATQNIWYVLDMHSNVDDYTWQYDATSAEVQTPVIAKTNYAALTDNNLFCFVGNPWDGFKIYNKGAGNTMTLRKETTGNTVSHMSTTDDHNQFKLYASRAIDGAYCFKIDGDDCYLNKQNLKLQGYNDNDQGSSVRFIQPGVYHLTAMETWNLDAPLGAVGTKSYIDSESLRQNMINARSSIMADPFCVVGQFTLMNTIMNPVNESAAIALDDGYYRIVSALSNFSQDRAMIFDPSLESPSASDISASIANKVVWSMLVNDNVGNIFRISESATDDKYYIYSPNKQEYLSANDGSTTAAAADLTINELGSSQFNITAGSDAMHAQGWNWTGTYGSQRGQLVQWAGGANSASAWYIVKANDVDINLNNDGAGNYYATMCLPFDVTISGANAYTLALDGTGTWLVPTQLTGNNVPANTPVMLKGSSNTATATIRTAGDAFTTSNVNSLSGTNTAKDFALAGGATTEYFMGISDGVVGFYHSGVASKTGYYTLKANRAYLQEQYGQARGYEIMWNDSETTGVNEVIGKMSEATDGAVYDLQGRKVANPSRGLYIINGKKVIIK